VHPTFDRDAARRSIVAVGPKDGRGFVVDINDKRLIITAGHCLPRLPIPGPIDTAELTFFEVLGLLEEELQVAAECLFVDPVSDLAVLGPPDDQQLPKECDAYEGLMASAVPLPIGDVQGEPGDDLDGWLCSLAGEWFKCRLSHNRGSLWVSQAGLGVVGGMSGSPILRNDGVAVGVVSRSGGAPGVRPEGGPNPCLIDCLPARLLRGVTLRG
jgi:hypothetical protein